MAFSVLRNPWRHLSCFQKISPLVNRGIRTKTPRPSIDANKNKDVKLENAKNSLEVEDLSQIGARILTPSKLPSDEVPPIEIKTPLAIGYKPLLPGEPRRFEWPLYGTSILPEITPMHDSVSKSLFKHGAKYLGDEIEMFQKSSTNNNSTIAGNYVDPAWIEMPVIGRSNVGKSTLLKKLLQISSNNSFIKVSKTPGSTKTLDFYALLTEKQPNISLQQVKFVIVDTPGYGFASGTSKHVSREWLKVMLDYFQRRSSLVLTRVLVLLDARLGITKLDEEVLRVLEEAFVPYHVCLTKVDTVSDGELEMCAYKTGEYLAKLDLAYPVLSAISAKTNQGISQLQIRMVQSTKVHRKFMGKS
jgi:GTP-binding protein